MACDIEEQDGASLAICITVLMGWDWFGIKGAGGGKSTICSIRSSSLRCVELMTDFAKRIFMSTNEGT